MSIVVVGSVAYDDLETPTGMREKVLGGSATHFSVAASFFTPVKLVGVVGGDFGDDHVAFLRSRRIDLAGLEVVKEKKTFHWRGRYGRDLNQAETLRTDLNVFEEFKPILPAEFAESPHLFLANIDPALQMDVMEQMAARPRWVACDSMNLWITTRGNELRAVLKRVDIFLVNEGEARLLSGEHNIVRGARRILAMGPKILVVKRGEYGALLFGGDEIFAAPALPLEDVTDPTGAGDAFAGGFLGHLSRAGRLDLGSLKQAMICGSVMASFQVEDFGLNRMIRLSHTEIETRYGDFQALAHFHGLVN